ncbi:MAG: cytochrome c biogenesis protein CcsA [Flavisolibacter sp.]|nr:cytochrome c biogenesis protein CcsA [Flavisolibacter sp.]
MDFIGENLVPGQLGHFFILISLIASLAATVAYFFSAQKTNPDDKLKWRNLARIFFIAETISIVSIFAILFFIISNHLFEYKYAWQHSSRSLEMKYLLSCFWEGQEGSFLLWSFWHCILGLVIMKKEKLWEAPVMTVVSFMQFCLATMIAGIAFLNLKIGSNPFVLLRNELEAPIFSRPDYLMMVQDGNDLNPLLQNYWMVIHPPVLFLGFAATLIPFAYAISGLWKRDFTGWVKPALPWALFAAAVLGLGIAMGAAWAYESLNFGGYWAWDPVENASLVPWLILIAGIHTMLIFRHTGNALRASFLFILLSFLLVLYSTYLTRSGDLQETSVHAFTDLGMKWQLRTFLLLFLLPSAIFYIQRYKNIPFIKKEEESSSREFLMFIGSLVFFLSALTIILMTSLPVINKIASAFAGEGTELFKPLAFGEDTAFAYNRIQIFVAIIIGLLTAISQYFKYKSTPKAFVTRKLLYPAIASVVIGALILAFGNINYDEYGIGYLGAIWFAIVAAVFTIIANAAYIWIGLKGKLKISGGSIAHLGFGLMLLGVLISSSKKEVLSYNTSGILINFGKESKEKPGENLTLIKGVRTDMGKYWVTYEKEESHPEKPLWFYHLRFETKDGKENFVLKPNAFVNYKGNEGLMANPDAKHYWSHDIFTYITSLPDPEKNKDTASFRTETIKVGDTLFYSKGYAVLDNINSRDNIPQPGFKPTDSATIATLKVYAKSQSLFTMEPLLVNKGGQLSSYPDTLIAENLVVQLQNIRGNEAEFGIKESDSVMQYVTLKAYNFPYINLLWLGILIMVVGLIMSTIRRVQLNRVPVHKI